MSTPAPVLLVSEGAPILMKIPSGTACVGFASEDLGRRYLAAFGINAAGLSFAAIESVVSAWPEEKKKSLPAVYFRSVDDLALLAKDRKAFPYSDYAVPLHEFEPRAKKGVSS